MHGMASSQARHQHGIYSDCCSMHLCDAYFAWSPFQQQQLQAQIHLHIHTLCPSSKHPLCPSLVRAIAGFIFLSICSSCQKMRKLTFCSNIGLLYIKLILFSCWFQRYARNFDWLLRLLAIRVFVFVLWQNLDKKAYFFCCPASWRGMHTYTGRQAQILLHIHTLFPFIPNTLSA